MITKPAIILSSNEFCNSIWPKKDLLDLHEKLFRLKNKLKQPKIHTQSKNESTYSYAPANNVIVKKVSSIEAICRKYDVPLKAASLQFPLFHPLVASVIPGVLDKVQVLENIQMIKHPIPLELWLDLKNNGLMHPEAPVTLPF